MATTPKIAGLGGNVDLAQQMSAELTRVSSMQTANVEAIQSQGDVLIDTMMSTLKSNKKVLDSQREQAETKRDQIKASQAVNLEIAQEVDDFTEDNDLTKHLKDDVLQIDDIKGATQDRIVALRNDIEGNNPDGTPKKLGILGKISRFLTIDAKNRMLTSNMDELTKIHNIQNAAVTAHGQASINFARELVNWQRHKSLADQDSINTSAALQQAGVNVADNSALLQYASQQEKVEAGKLKVLESNLEAAGQNASLKIAHLNLLAQTSNLEATTKNSEDKKEIENIIITAFDKFNEVTNQELNSKLIASSIVNRKGNQSIYSVVTEFMANPLEAAWVMSAISGRLPNSNLSQLGLEDMINAASITNVTSKEHAYGQFMNNKVNQFTQDNIELIKANPTTAKELQTLSGKDLAAAEAKIAARARALGVNQAEIFRENLPNMISGRVISLGRLTVTEDLLKTAGFSQEELDAGKKSGVIPDALLSGKYTNQAELDTIFKNMISNMQDSKDFTTSLNIMERMLPVIQSQLLAFVIDPDNPLTVDSRVAALIDKGSVPMLVDIVTGSKNKANEVKTKFDLGTIEGWADALSQSQESDTVSRNVANTLEGISTIDDTIWDVSSEALRNKEPAKRPDFFGLDSADHTPKTKAILDRINKPQVQ